MECPACGNPVYGAISDGGDSGTEQVMVRYRCSRCGTEAREPEPYTAEETGYEAIEAQIIDLFEQMSPGAQANLIDNLIAIADIEEESDNDNQSTT